MSAITGYAPALTREEPQVSRLYATLSLTAFISILVLITVGSIVRVTGNGLGCPDWPLCYGQVVPPLKLSAWVEFSHRFVGAVTSAQLVGLGFLAWKQYRREVWIFVPAMFSLVLLVVQVSLGGIHVLFELPPSSGWMHTGVAMALAGMVASQVAVTHPALRALTARVSTILKRDRGLPIALATTAAVTYLLILTGAYVTRSGASLACPAFPACGAEATQIIYPQLVRIQLLHRFMAFGVALTATFTLWRLARAARAERGLRGAVFGLAALIVVQFGLGVSNVLLRLPPWSRTLHLLVAAILWTGLVMMGVVLWRGRPHRAEVK
jgi:heme A synthase